MLTIPSALLGELIAGAVYHDGVGEVTALRRHLAWYPDDVWRYLLAASWRRIGQEEHLMPRAGEAGDELGASIIGARLVREVMRLCFLLERRYAPYPKWFGTAFARLQGARELAPLLWQAQRAATWQERENALVPAYEALARMHNRLGMTRKMSAIASSFYDRPFLVIHGDQFAQALVEQIQDLVVRHLAENRLIGNIDQWSDNTDLCHLKRSMVRHVYSE